MKSHVERVWEWLEKNVQVFPTPEVVTLSDFSVDWNNYCGDFLVSIDSVESSERFIFRLELNGKVALELPMFHSPLGAPASYAAVKITNATHQAILKGLHETFPCLKAVGIDTETGERIERNTPLEDRIEIGLLTQAKNKVGKNYSITIKLDNGINSVLLPDNDSPQIITILEKLSITQNEASFAVKRDELNDAHLSLKETTITIFENVGDDKAFDLETAVRLFLIFFRAAFYLENKSGEFLYRYQAIPGQLGNVCFFQLGLSKQDASGYTPEPDAVKECSAAAHRLLSQYAQTIAIQTTSQRSEQVATSYPNDDIDFTNDTSGHSIVRVINHSRGKVLDFSKPRFFGFATFKSAIDVDRLHDPLYLLKMVEAHMSIEI